ncbi:putative RNA-directed DNA polymerase from transposon BS [Merluccius polli]|uniref:RNA-directed DNA polymerase from transposon BS n=1 Tax=Merluccius polli TaxID=89951 RepID=A0AA47NSH3_MERPO|nr:putative RNA-directed DNA polymerase from transposon BS [Merluccius polli]
MKDCRPLLLLMSLAVVDNSFALPDSGWISQLTVTATTKQQQQWPSVYSRDELLQHRDRPVVCPKAIPWELRIRRHGTRAGAMVRNKKTERRWRYKPRLPSVIMWNGRSLPNKADELSALITGQREYRECSVLCLTETWLNRKMFTHLFGLSLRLKKVPTLWKTSCVVPVPKKGRPSAPKDFRPVAPTSHVMKTFERMVLEHLRPLVRDCLDPLQLAYQTDIGVDAIICLLSQSLHTHLERPQSMVRIMFFDFSSAFDTVQSARLAEKLQVMQVDPDMVAWITNYLTDRPQYVMLRHCLSDVGTVLSPFLFTLYTSDFCYNSRTCHLQKFSDDSSIVGCITDNREEEYRELVENFVGWCDGNHLQLNTGKIKELKVPIPVSINGEEVEMVDTYKFLGVHLNNKLDWSDNSEALYRKGQCRLFFLRRLRSFNVCTRLLQMFYQSVVASATFFAIVCWGGGIGSGGASKLNKLVRKASSVVGMKLDCVEAVTERRMKGKLQAIMDNPSHPLYAELRQLRSTFSHRLTQPRASKNLGGSFIPSAIRLYNTSTPRSQRLQSPKD